MGGVGGVCKVIFMSNPTVVLRLGWGWGFDNRWVGGFGEIETKTKSVLNEVGVGAGA